ncbi:cyclic peptide export ABC transporter [Pyxidicoccus trucidator]|uniref:cyclic peptide export ABC transporter n=1 Tax=Pyxidicoccus trucidator TaxID=2709662 RepID=UPI0013DBEB78|nr:cyclic peptide export ABC transporter [Pyxidicoccus trucidator]
MNLLLILLRKSTRLAVLTLVLGVLSGISSASLLGLIHHALAASTQSSVSDIAMTFVAVAVAALLTRMGSGLMINRLQQKILLDLRLWLSRHLLSTSLRTMEEAGAHRMLSSLMQDIATLTTGVVMLPEVFISSSLILGGLGYLGWLSWPLCLLGLSFMVVGQLTFALPSRLGQRYQEQAREESTLLLRRFFSLAEAAKEFRLNRQRRRDFYDNDLGPLARTVGKLYLRTDDTFSIAGSWGMSVYTLTIGIMLLVVPRYTSISPAEVMGAVLVVLYLQQPLNAVVNCAHSLRRAEVAMAHIEKLGLKLTPEFSVEAALTQAVREPPRDFERIDLAGVTHTYRNERDGEKFTLGPITTTLHRGELLFLVGGNGSGKTTLAKLLTGLYTPESGELRVDGRPVTTPEAVDDYRQLFSAVFFDFFLFDKLLGISSPELLQQANRYLEHLHLDKKVTIEADGKLSTLTLSQGQRKRLALLTAYLEDRPVYLFDEWAADQDPTFKDVFYKQILLDLKGRGKAVVVISHDDRYFHLADRVIHLESGQLVSDKATGGKEAPGALSA